MPIDPHRWQRLGSWLDAVLDRPAGEREAWLDELAAHEPDVAAELRLMLAGAAAGAGAAILQGDMAQALHGPADFDTQAASEARASLAGQRIGAYTLIEPLGEGGMGMVWLAQRSDGRFEGRAAVKLLHAGLVQRALAERFRREGAILARLAHPHIARLVDAGLTDGGQPYLVLEHVAGERIDRWCDAKHLDLRARLQLFGQVLQAVQHAHAQLVVHRDLKPANVMVDESGGVKLLDFGIAKLINTDDAAQATELTRDGGRVLTPLYAAPEQTRGDAVSTATDVYALGLVLYGLLTGQHPRVDAQGRHAAPESASSGAAPSELPLASRAVIDAKRRTEAELRAAAEARGGLTPARLAGALAGDLDNILAKALRHEATERYGTVAAFADDLKRHLEGHTVSARPDSWAYRTSRFVRRNRLAVSLATAALVLIVGVAIVAEHQRREAEHQRQEAERERDAATRQRENAEAIVMFLGEQLGQADEPGRPADPGRRVDLAQQRAEQLFRDVPEVLVPLYGRFHGMNAALNRIEAADRIAAAIETSAAQHADAIMRAQVWCGPHRDDMSDADAITRIDRGLALLDDRPGARAARSRCLFHRSSHMKGAARFDEALRDLDASHEADPPLLRRVASLSYLRSRALMLNELGQVHAAEQAQGQLIEQMQAAGRGNSVQAAGDLHWRCILQWRMGRPGEGLDSCEQARSLAERTGHAELVPFVDMFRARLSLDLDRKKEAQRLLEAPSFAKAA